MEESSQTGVPRARLEVLCVVKVVERERRATTEGGGLLVRGAPVLEFKQEGVLSTGSVLKVTKGESGRFFLLCTVRRVAGTGEAQALQRLWNYKWS